MRGSKAVSKKAIKTPEVAHSFSMAISPTPKHLDKYEIEDAARHLERHQEIKSNKKLHRAAIKHLKTKAKAIAKAVKEK